MDTNEYKRRLLEKEKELVKRREVVAAEARSETGAIETGDKSVTDADEGEKFGEADMDTNLLQQVRDALGRIENGTFGKCIVDGRPISEKRLEAIPWTPYCRKHEQESERSRGVRTPTL
ncbi:MAG: TraR/DksA C4-type zinc finger protein [Acidobacteriaceae bacterium]